MPRQFLTPRLGLLTAIVLVVTCAMEGTRGGLWAPPSAAFAAPSGQAAPGPFVKQAFDLLMDRFVTPPSSATILGGGWDGGATFARDQAGIEAGDPRPAFSGDREGDWRAFLEAYPRLVAAAGGADQVELDRAVVRGMAQSLNSNGTFYQRPGQVGANQAEYAGIGVNIGRDLVVNEVYEGSPAEAGGVRPGDLVMAVDGASVVAFTSAQLSERVRGPVGTPVQVTLQRPGLSEPLALALTRATVVLDWISVRVRDGGIGYLRLRRWPRSEELNSLQDAVNVLEQGDVRGLVGHLSPAWPLLCGLTRSERMAPREACDPLVLDLRGAGGGPMEPYAKVISRFVRSGPIYQTTNRQGQRRTVEADGSFWGRDIPIVSLVNESTGGNSELAALTLREHGAGPVIGTKTFGGLSIFGTSPLDDGSTLGIAVQDLRSGQGTVVEGVGLTPDIVAERDAGALIEGRDPQLEAALTYLQGKLGQ